MIKDPVATPMEPFTADEEQALYDRLDLLSVTALTDYIASAKTSLANKALAPTWRPRVELALKRAESALIKAEAAAVLAAEAALVPAPAAPAAPAAKSRSKKEKAPVAVLEEE